jgi:hypothetical protein
MVYPKIHPKFIPIQTINEAKGQPRDTPAKVLVKPLGTGRKTSAVKADITINEVTIKFPCDQAKASSPYIEKEVSKSISGIIKVVVKTMKKESHFNQDGKFILEL